MNEITNFKNEEEIIIIENNDDITNDNILNKLCTIQKLLKKESSLIELSKKNNR